MRDNQNKILSAIKGLAAGNHPDTIFKNMIAKIQNLISKNDSHQYTYTMLLGLSYFLEDQQPETTYTNFLPNDNQPYKVSIKYFQYYEKYNMTPDFNLLRIYLLSKKIPNPNEILLDLYKKSSNLTNTTLSTTIVGKFLDKLMTKNSNISSANE